MIACAGRADHAERSLHEKEVAVTDRDRQLADLHRQLAEAQAAQLAQSASGGAAAAVAANVPPAVPLERPGAAKLQGWTSALV